MGSRLCIPDLVGSSRITRFMIIFSSLEGLVSKRVELRTGVVLLSEPAFLAAKSASCLSWGGRHEDES